MFSRVISRLAGAGTVALSVSAASAATIGIDVDTFAMSQVPEAQSAYDSYTAGTNRRTVEDFESFSSWNGVTGTRNPVATKAGTLHGVTRKPGSGGSAVNGGTGLEIRENDGVGTNGVGRLHGRQNYGSGGTKWLDSNDLDKMVWKIDAGSGLGRFDSLAFFLGDVSDIKGTKFRIKVKAEGFDTKWARIQPQKNGTINLVSILFDAPVDAAKVILKSNHNDGFGIDNLTVAQVAPVPLPPAALLLVGGIAGLGAVGRRRGKRAA